MISRLVEQPLDETLSSPARAPRPSEVSDPIVTIDTSKMTLALEEGLKKTTSASKVLALVAVRRVCR